MAFKTKISIVGGGSLVWHVPISKNLYNRNVLRWKTLPFKKFSSKL